MDCIVHGIAKSQTGLSDFHCHVLGFPGSSHGKESTCNVGDHGMIPGSGRFPWRRDRLPNPVFMGFPGVSAGKESACNVEEVRLAGQRIGEGKHVQSILLLGRI